MEATQRKDGEGGGKNPWSRLPTWGKWTAGVVGGLALLGIGVAIGAASTGSLTTERDDARAELAEATQQRDRARDVAASIRSRRADIIGTAKSRATKIVRSARAERSELADRLTSLRDEVTTTQSELQEAESSLGTARREKRLSSFGDGIWQADTDFIPGTYRTEGRSGCYWAKLNSTDTFDIADNENGEGPQVVTLDTPFFQTKGCGTWERAE